MTVTTSDLLAASEPVFARDANCLLTMLETHARYLPEQVAVKDSCRSLSYRLFMNTVWENAKKLSVRLDDEVQFIGLYCDPSVDMVTAAWSILAAERAYLPLAPDYPVERLRYMIQDSGISVVLTQPHLKTQLAALVDERVTIITLDELAQADTRCVRRPAAPVKPERFAYMIYTSGSTGKPKGVMVTYANISSQIAWLKNQFGFDHNDRILQKTPASFDAAQWEILAPAFGSQVYVGAKDCYRDPDAMIDTLLTERITVLQCVPTLLQALVDHPLFQDCSALKQVFSGGEILTRNLAQAFFHTLPHSSLTNLYGPTECTINASSFTLEPEQVSAYPDAIAIGKPVAHTRYHILNSDGEPVAPGETGELYISGAQVAQGYYQRPALTREKFIEVSGNPAGHERLYRTGDLVREDTAGYVHFVGRVDNQIKLRGYRVELDEIRLSIENHHWVKTAAVLVQQDPRSGNQNLVACIALDPRQAALMDQGHHDAHHLSKSSKLQVKAQLSNAGCRKLSPAQLASGIALPYSLSDVTQRQAAFGRKTYRFFEGAATVTADALVKLLGRQPQQACPDENLHSLSLEKLGKLLRNFGQFVSEHRLLPKYAWASPGALYATQLYLELRGVAGLPPAIYYYHPIHHTLTPIAPCETGNIPSLRLHFIGNRSAIEPVYKNNLREVIEMETGHMLGLFDELLPTCGLYAERSASQRGALPDWYDGSPDDDYLGGYALGERPFKPSDAHIALYVQIAQSCGELKTGTYRYHQGALQFMTEAMLQKKDVIAINQRVFERAHFGISVVCQGDDREEHYILAGREMHRLQSNQQRLGLMSSGYSSKSNHDLPAATKMRDLLQQQGLPMDSLYFCVGGPVSEAQYDHEGMHEDRIHMQGPVELLKEDLAAQLPHYMIPHKVIILDTLPLTANGKIDYQALQALPELTDLHNSRENTPLSSETEKMIGDIWCAVMKWEAVFAEDDFFASGGNSLTAVALVNRINKTFDIKLPLQAIFQTPTVPGLAAAVDACRHSQREYSRLIKLNNFDEKPIFCWPGLGGYPLSLRYLAQQLPDARAFYGIQSLGINEGERPLLTIQQMAYEDILQIKKVQPTGPYTLWGYSFGARVAFETAAQLEAQGDEVDALFLLAPGAPVTQMERERAYKHRAEFDNPVFKAILFSVFAQQVDGPLLDRCLKTCHSRAAFIRFICQRFPLLQHDMVERIIRIVETTYEFSYQFRELQNRQLRAPVTIVKAQGDRYSFLERAPAFSLQPPRLIELQVDHYAVLKQAGVSELLARLTPLTHKEPAYA